MRRFLAHASVIFAASLSVPAYAQIQNVERAVSGPPDKPIQIAVYIDVRPDCTSGPLPAITLSYPPSHGSVAVRRANVTATNYKKCLALQVPAFVAFYRSMPAFAGVDTLTLNVRYPGGRTEIQRITVTITTPAIGKQI